MKPKEYAVYTILGYDLKGNKEILGLWLNQTESKIAGCKYLMN